MAVGRRRHTGVGPAKAAQPTRPAGQAALATVSGWNRRNAPGAGPDLQRVAIDIALRTDDGGVIVFAQNDVGDEGDPA